MIKIKTKLRVNDNSGIKKAECIKIYKKPYGIIGDIILISIKELRHKKNNKTKFKKGELLKALIIHTKYKKKSTIGNIINFDDNVIILLNNQNKPLGTRVFGPITSEFRKNKFFKLLSLCSNII